MSKAMSHDDGRVHLCDLSHAQIGALLLAHERPLQLRPGGRHPGLQAGTVNALVRFGLLRITSQRVAELTPRGYALADLAITLSREIAAAVAGREAPQFTPDAPAKALPVIARSEATTQSSLAPAGAQETADAR